MAHDVGSPFCPGELEMVVSFAGRPPDSSDPVRERLTSRRSRIESRDHAADPAQDPG
jgi:hypothetical protein